MNYVGIDWAYGRAAWCAVRDRGGDRSEGLISADEDGLARLVLRPRQRSEAGGGDDERGGLGPGPAASTGWSVEAAHARKVRDVAPLACKTDKVDAGSSPSSRRRDLVPALWVPTPEDRALRAAPPPRPPGQAPPSARNRIFGLLTQFGLHALSFAGWQARRSRAARAPRGAAGLASLDRRACRAGRGAGPLNRPDRPRPAPLAQVQTPRPAAPDDPRGRGADRPHLSRRDRRGLALRRPRKLVGYAGLAPRVSQSARRSATGVLSKAGPRRSAGPRSRPPTAPGARPIPSTRTTSGSRLATEITRPSLRSRASCSSPPGTCFAQRAIQPTCPGELLPLSDRPTVPHGIETPGPLPGTICAQSAEREMSHSSTSWERHEETDPRWTITP